MSGDNERGAGNQWTMLFRELDAIKSSLAELRAEIRQEVTDLRAETKQEVADLRERVSALEQARAYALGWVCGVGLVSGAAGALLLKWAKL